MNIFEFLFSHSISSANHFFFHKKVYLLILLQRIFSENRFLNIHVDFISCDLM